MVSMGNVNACILENSIHVNAHCIDEHDVKVLRSVATLNVKTTLSVKMFTLRVNLHNP